GRNVRWAGYAECEVDKKQVECRVDLLDVQKWLKAEAAAAYELLSTPQHLPVFYKYAGPEMGLARAIRSDHLKSNGPSGEHSAVEQLRLEFFRDLHADHKLSAMVGGTAVPAGADSCPSEIEILAWAVVVESALLNEQL